MSHGCWEAEKFCGQFFVLTKLNSIPWQVVVCCSGWKCGQASSLSIVYQLAFVDWREILGQIHSMFSRWLFFCLVHAGWMLVYACIIYIYKTTFQSLTSSTQRGLKSKIELDYKLQGHKKIGLQNYKANL